jgi:hypothetical protein
MAYTASARADEDALTQAIIAFASLYGLAIGGSRPCFNGEASAHLLANFYRIGLVKLSAYLCL